MNEAVGKDFHRKGNSVKRSGRFSERPDSENWKSCLIPFPKIRDSETTIKIKFAILRGVGLRGREENRPKTLFFTGNATTIKF